MKHYTVTGYLIGRY